MQAFSYPFTIHSLKFDVIPVKAYSSAGTEYTRLIRVGMPKLPDQTINLAFYLYKSQRDAQKGVEIGGTGFFAGVPSEKHPAHVYIYGITNRHVIGEGASVIRVNMNEGATDIFKYRTEDWDSIDGLGDIAISPILEIQDKHNVCSMSIDGFATNEIISKRGINIGEGVFMVGRFIDHDGGTTNLPAVRFGHISVMPTFIPDEEYNQNGGKCFIIDMHSRPGYSGSPVIVYRTLGGDLSKHRAVLTSYDQFIYLLGLHWGQFPEPWKANGTIIEGFSGMTCVIPAERILSLINKPEIKAERDRRDAEYTEKHGYHPIPD